MRFIHAADIHLDSPMHRLEVYDGAPVDEIRHASRRAVENLVDLALDEQIDFVLIAGDLFDGDWRDYNTGLYFVAQMRRLSEAGIRVFIASGNHDAAGQMTRRLPYPKTVHLFSPSKPETRIVEDLHVAIHGQSFGKAAVTENLAACYPKPLPDHINIGLLHTSLTGREGHENYAPCALDDLVNNGYDYWALGHVHQAEIIAHEPAVVFPGCIQGRHVKERGAKGCMVVELEPGMPANIRPNALDVIRWERVLVDVAEADTLDALIEAASDGCLRALEDNDPLPVIVRIEICGSTGIHQRLVSDPEHVKQVIRSAALASFGDRVWIEKVLVNTTPLRRESADAGPMQELSLVVGELMQDEDRLLALGETLGPVFKKLPADYRLGESRIHPDDPQMMRDLVEQAHALLALRLSKAGGRP